MRSQRGDAAARVLFLMVAVAIVAAVAAPWFLRSTRTEDERKAIGTLRRIHAAEQDHFGGTRLYASMSKLSGSRLFDGPATDEPFTRDGYRFSHSLGGAMSKWCADAVPEPGKEGKTFGTDESGVVLEYERAVTPCIGGVLVRTGGSPVR